MATSPILLIPYMWIGDFVRCHSVIQLLKARNPSAPIDVLTTSMVAPLLDYMPGRPQGHRRRSAPQAAGARPASRAGRPAARGRLRPGPGHAAHLEGRAGAFPRRNSAAHRLCRRSPLRPDQRPALGRTGAAPHDRPVRLARPAEGRRPARRWPLPELEVPAAEIAAWRQRLGLAADGRPAVALAPGAVGPSKRWPSASYAALAGRLAAEGNTVWVIGGPGEQALAAEIVAAAPDHVRDLTGPDLRNAILALAAAQAAVSNDSGLLHVAAAIGTPGDRHLRPDQPVALGAAQPDRRGDPSARRDPLPALPQAGLPPRSPSLHDRDSGRAGRCRRALPRCKPAPNLPPKRSDDAIERVEHRPPPRASCPAPPTTAIGPLPNGPVRPGSLPTKIPTAARQERRQDAASRCRRRSRTTRPRSAPPRGRAAAAPAPRHARAQPRSGCCALARARCPTAASASRRAPASASPSAIQ